MELFVHYGHRKFDRALFRPIANIPGRNKPAGGLWASPVNAKFGWKDWNETEQYARCDEDNCFRFNLTDDAQIYWIRTKEDVKAMEHMSSADLMEKRSTMSEEIDALIRQYDFERMAKEYDAICFEVNRETYYALYAWDCDSILILNPAVVKEVAA